MNEVVRKIIERTRRDQKRILLPEATDPRILRATNKLTHLGYAKVVLLGDPDDIHILGKELKIDLSGVDIVDPLTDPRRQEYIRRLTQRRRKKGMTPEDADKLLRGVVYYGGMMVDDDRVDGMVAGSLCPTRDTVRSALYTVGIADGINTLSACTLMNTIVPEVGTNGTLIFADTGVVPEPTAEQLADIAIAAADSSRALLHVEPYVAMLSFSTKGSAHSPAVQKVIDATRLVQTRRGDIKVDGELQLDAAIIPDISRRKTPDSQVTGRANTLIFPDLSSANIGYKLVERLGKATALGPLLIGLKKPVNDLSRGCSEDDIVLITALTAIQAQPTSESNVTPSPSQNSPTQ